MITSKGAYVAEAIVSDGQWALGFVSSLGHWITYEGTAGSTVALPWQEWTSRLNDATHTMKLHDVTHTVPLSGKTLGVALRTRTT